MEYLMTYGWAILVISVVLGALFSLGVFSGSNFEGTACIPNPGFYCSGIVFSVNIANSYGDPSITVNLGSTAASSTSDFFVIVPQGQAITDITAADQANPNDFWYWGKVFGQFYYAPSFSQGQVSTAQIYISASFPGMALPLQIGTKLNGAIWEMYTTSTTANALVQVGTFTAVSTLK